MYLPPSSLTMNRYYYLHFIDEGNWGREYVTCLRLHSYKVAEAVFKIQVSPQRSLFQISFKNSHNTVKQLYSNKKFFIAMKKIFNWSIVSGIQWSDSVTYVSGIQILFPYRLLQDINYSSLCCTLGPCWWSVLSILVCIC